MELFLRAIQGAYAYLLIALILIVSGLFLSLLWLIVKRTKDVAEATSTAVLDTGALVATPVVADPSAIAASSAELESVRTENQSLKAKIETLENEIKGSLGATDRAKELNEKVQFLESKLLEYEILQEEIGTLSSLKIENEQLKQRLVQAGIPVSDTGAGLQTQPPLPDVKSEPLDGNVATPATSTHPVQEGAPASGDNLDSLLAEIDKLTAGKDPSPPA